MARKMKNCGVEWIGMIPDGWQVCPIKYVATLYTGNSIKDEDKDFYMDSDDARPYVATKDVDAVLGTVNYDNGQYIKRADTSFKVAPANSILMCIEGGSAGRKKALLNQEVSFVNKLCCFNGSSKMNGSYLYRFLSSPNYEEEFACHVSGMIGGVSVSELKSIPIIVPPLSEQQRIADFLDAKCASIDVVIAKTNESIEEYKKLKQSVITEAVTKGVRGNRSMKESGFDWLKTIPKEWNQINPKALFSLRKDRATETDRQLTSSQQYGVIYQDEYMQMTGNKVVVVEKDFDILKHVEAGDFVISMRSFQGGLEYSTNTGSISSAYVMLIPNLQLVEPRYYRWLLKSPVYINALQSTSNLVRDGQAMRYSNFAQVRLFKVPLDEQREIADYLDSKCAAIDTLISKKQQFIDELTAYKKSLIYEYVTGKKEVPA